MRKLILFMAFVCLGLNALAQVPNKISYQTVVRDSGNELVVNKTIGIEISILQSSQDGSPVFTEVHKVMTNANGLASLVIGNGEQVNGSLEEIKWENGPYYIKSATDLYGGENYTIVGVSELLSVPYSFNSKSAENVFSGNYKDLLNKPVNISEFINDVGYITEQNIIDGTFGPGNGVPAQVWSLFGNSNTDPSVDKLGTTDYTDLVIVTDNLDRLRIQANGDINIDKSLEVGEDLTVSRNVYLNTESGQTINNGNLTVANTSSTLLTGTLEVDGATNLNSTLDVNNFSATNLTGTLDVDGAANLNSTLDVNNSSATNLTGTLDVDGLAQFESNLNVDASTVTDFLVVTDEETPNATPRYGSIADIRGYFVADSISIVGGLDIGGSLKVHGDSVVVDNHLRVGETTTLQNSLNVSGATSLSDALTVSGVSTLNNTLNVNGSSSYVANFVNSTDANGIKIKVEAGTPDSSNNFVTMQNSGGTTVGRIEGQSLSELQNSFRFIWDNTMAGLDEAFVLAEGVACGTQLDAAEVIVMGLQGLQKYVQWVELANYAESNVGVSFSSGSGDYAEWLEKYSQLEIFSSGDIVGVKGGMISKNLPNPDKYMVVSTSPIVLGNMPDIREEHKYEKIAFMGQVPVKVRGSVNIGDYIIASNLMDGFGIAVNPNDITLNEYERIVGVAWSETTKNNGVSMVNIAVGINTNDAVREIKKQQAELNNVKKQLNSVLSYLESKDPSFEASHFTLKDDQIENSFISEEKSSDKNGVTGIKGNKQVINNLISVFTAQPDLLEKILSDAREILDEKGVNYNKFDQTKRLVTDTSYFLGVLQEYNN